MEWEFDWNAFASWYEAENFKEPDGRSYNGSGQLIYRGAVMNYDAQSQHPAESDETRLTGLRVLLVACTFDRRSKGRRRIR